jgi:hypothetical protein
MAIKIHKIGVYIQVLWYMALESHFKFCVEVLFFSFTGTQTTLNNANFVWNTYLDERKKSQIEPACNQSLNPQPKNYIKTHEEKKDGSRARSNISIDWRNKNIIYLESKNENEFRSVTFDAVMCSASSIFVLAWFVNLNKQ